MTKEKNKISKYKSAQNTGFNRFLWFKLSLKKQNLLNKYKAISASFLWR
jgi:hypothetical protein